MGVIDDLRGKRFGSLTVNTLVPDRKNGYACYLCQCDCGNVTLASSRQIKSGSIRACEKCIPRKTIRILDLTGQTFGSLTVERLLDRRLYGRRTWLCRCSCGKIKSVTTHDLQNGRITNCGGSEHRRYMFNDLAGKRFGKLTVIQRVSGGDRKGSLYWLCQCECGKQKVYSADVLMNGKAISCGCYKKTVVPLKMIASRHYIDGTCVEALNRKMRSDNTSGIPGVHECRNGKWKAEITFKGVRHYLGTFEKKEEAVQARKQGEEMHENFLREFYAQKYSMTEE